MKGWIWYFLIGLLAGWLASVIVKGRGSGCLVNVLVGVVGSVVGGWLFGQFGLFPSSSFAGFIMAVVGAIVLLWIANLISRS